MERKKLIKLLWAYKFNSDKEKKIAYKIEELRSSKTSVAISYDRVPGGGTSTMSDYIVRLTDLETELAHYASDKLLAYNKVTGIINSLAFDTDKEIMYQRYILWKNWQEIADDMCYSYERIRHKHSEILTELEKSSTF